MENGWSSFLEDCALCPRNCHVDRLKGKTGYCGQSASVTAARAALHFWEEPCISGRAGSGAVFFSGCSVRCIFCQNREIAAGRAGRAVTQERLAEIFLELQEKGANNINLVTPTHFVPQIADALERAKDRGLAVPVVYNTSSYEKVSTLRMLDGLVDIYLPDLKYVSSRLSAALSDAPDYFDIAKDAIEEMVRQAGEPVFISRKGELLDAAQMNDACMREEDADFLMRRGVIVRHLALPGQAEDSRRVLRYLHETYGNRIYISLMNQYTPMPDMPLRGAGAPDRKEQGAVSQRDAGAPDRKEQGASSQRDADAPGREEQGTLKRRGAEVSDRKGADAPDRALPEALSRRLSEEEYEALTDYAVELGIENGFLQEGDTAQESFIPAFDGEGL